MRIIDSDEDDYDGPTTTNPTTTAATTATATTTRSPFDDIGDLDYDLLKWALRMKEQKRKDSHQQGVETKKRNAQTMKMTDEDFDTCFSAFALKEESDDDVVWRG